MHGEYKTPSGKLVVVDFAVRDGRLADVMVSGDFFLEPPEALDAIDRALENLSTTLPPTELAERIRSALGPGVEMVGFDPDAVARAVLRALS